MTDHFSRGDALEAHERETPQHTAAVVDQYDRSIDRHRAPVRGHRTGVTPTQVLAAVRDITEGGRGLGAQIAAYRRIRALKSKAPGPWHKAAVAIGADAAQLLDPLLHRDRAERIAIDEAPAIAKHLRAWINEESL